MLAEPVEGRKQLTGDCSTGVDGDRITIDVQAWATMTIGVRRRSRDAKLVLTDRLIAATAPLSTRGRRDEIRRQKDGLKATLTKDSY